jgi:sugar phosphate isomerase/epimerase
MKLAVIGDEISQDFEVVVETTIGAGFDGVEVRSVDGIPPHQLSDAQLDKIRDGLLAAGLAVAGFASPVFKSPLPRSAAEVDAARDMLRCCAAQAARIGAPHLRVFTFFRDGEPDPVTSGRVARQVLEGLELPVPLVVENGTLSNSPTLELTLRFLDALGRDDIGVLWDPGNSVFSGFHAEPFPRDYEMGRDRIRHVHVKEPDGTRGYVRLGDGSLNWPRILDQLAQDGYVGWVSLETHWRTSRVLTKHQRDVPWGQSFSEDGREASAECMSLLSQWRQGIGDR